MRSASPVTLARASWLAGLPLLGLSSCATEPSPERAVPEPSPPDTNVYFYPAAGQAISADQQNRDRFECNSWAVQQSHFDPSLPSVPPHQRVQVVAAGPPPGTGVAVGAVGGALLGGAVSRPWNAGSNMLFGALAGAAIGAVVDTERANQTRQLRIQSEAETNGARAAMLERGAADYRRAMAACLEGRGYSVR